MYWLCLLLHGTIMKHKYSLHWRKVYLLSLVFLARYVFRTHQEPLTWLSSHCSRCQIPWTTNVHLAQDGIYLSLKEAFRLVKESLYLYTTRNLVHKNLGHYAFCHPSFEFILQLEISSISLWLNLHPSETEFQNICFSSCLLQGNCLNDAQKIFLLLYSSCNIFVHTCK